ncbi:hypothetical protein [Demequina sp. NBRC 110054]|uniref:DUF7507 domain-containing protein n=1 Tax=Demequina sp. NBRC 110054 TaxID=1570343 RepID=UPI0009FC5050|nr:hypothetical protein [Demequina sp. NBRC 110054]
MIEPRRLRAPAGVLLAATMLGMTALLAEAAGSGDLLLDETFADGVVHNPHAIGLGIACLTAATTAPSSGDSNLGVCASSVGAPASAEGDGYLQLTDAQGSQVGSVVYDHALPSSAGLEVEFDQYQYGGNGADGIGFFLSDGSYLLEQTGATGGALGYAQQTWGGVDGVVGGYLGVGLDAFGNFAVDGDWEGRGNGCATPSPYGFVPNAVTLRGPGSGQDGYCVLTSTAADGDGDGTFTSTLPGNLRGSTLADAVRNVRVSVTPEVHPTVTVEIDFDGGRDSYVTVLSHTMADEAPETYKFGFSSSTGGYNDVHLVRNVVIATVDSLGELDLVAQIDNSTAQPDAYGEGEVVPLKFLVTNTGVDEMTDVAVTAPGVDGLVCDATTLGAAGTPTASTRCTGTVTITDDDVKSPRLVVHATATGVNSLSETLTDTDDVTIDLVQVPAMAVDGTATLATDVDGDGVAEPGDAVTYSYLVTNTGDVTLTEVALAGSLGGAVACTPTVLAPGESVTCTAADPYTVTEDDAAAGAFDDVVTGSATAPVGVAALADVVATTWTTAEGYAALAVDVSAAIVDDDGDGKANPGEEVEFTYTVGNLGDVSLSDLSVGSGLGLSLACAATNLPAPPGPGDVVVCTAIHPVTVDDAVAGAVDESATADASAPGMVADPAQATDATSVESVSVPGIVIAVAADLDDASGDGMANPGEEITYRSTVTNTGDVTLASVVVASAHGLAVTCEATTLEPGGVTACTSEAYTVAVSDAVAGSVDETATADGAAPAGIPDPAQASDSAATAVVSVPAMSVVGSAVLTDDADGDAMVSPGDSLAYSYLVTNTGDVTLSDVAIAGSLGGDVTCEPSVLAPGESVTCVAAGPYVVTEDDAAAGEVNDAVTGSATTPDGIPPLADVAAATATEADGTAALAIAVAAQLEDVNGDGKANAGETIAYAYTVTNSGAVTVSGIVAAGELGGALACPSASLVPGAAQVCTAEDAYSVTLEDAAHGIVQETATADATAPGAVEDPARATGGAATVAVLLADLDIVGAAVLALDVNGDGRPGPRDLLTYVYSVSNPGEAALTEIALEGSRGGEVACLSHALAPGESTVCVAVERYAVTQDDAVAGQIIDEISGLAEVPAGVAAIGPVPVATVVDVHAKVSIAVVSRPRLLDLNGDGVANLGEQVTFSYVVTNTSDVTLFGVGVDGSLGGEVSCGSTTLFPGESTVCVAAVPYTVSSADILAGRIEHAVVGSGAAPGALGEALAEAVELQATLAEIEADDEPEPPDGDGSTTGDTTTADDATSLAVTGAGAAWLAWMAAATAAMGVGLVLFVRERVRRRIV